jgi:protein-disulfide isomerase
MDSDNNQSENPQTTIAKKTNGEKMAIPIAIVLAGLLIAGSLYLVAKEKTTPTSTNNPSNQDQPTFSIPPVSDSDHILGNPEASVVLVEYSDLECPYCKDFHKTATELLGTYGKSGEFAWVYRHFPLQEIHPNAPVLALISECIATLSTEAMFWNFIDTVFAGPVEERFDLARIPTLIAEYGITNTSMENCQNAEDSPQKKRVTQDVSDALASKGRGTPHNVLIAKEGWNNEVVTYVTELIESGQVPPEALIFSSNGKHLVVEGAFPRQVFDAILTAQLH